MRSAHARFRDTGLFFHPRSTSRASTCSLKQSPATWHEPRKKEGKGREKIRGRKEYRWCLVSVTSLFPASLAINLAITGEGNLCFIEWSFNVWFEGEENLVLSFLSRRYLWVDYVQFSILLSPSFLINDILIKFFFSLVW